MSTTTQKWSWDALTPEQQVQKVFIDYPDSNQSIYTAKCLIEYSEELKNMYSELSDEDESIVFPIVDVDTGKKNELGEPITEKGPVVDYEVMSKILDWCYHIHNEASQKRDEDEPGLSPSEKQERAKANETRQEQEQTWAVSFFNCNANFDLFCKMMNGINFLHIPELMGYGCEVLMTDIQNLTPEEIRKRYELPDDLTEEEKREIEEEDIWTKPGDPDNPMPDSLRRIFFGPNTTPTPPASSSASTSSS